jgi:hypothetical protein
MGVSDTTPTSDALPDYSEPAAEETPQSEMALAVPPINNHFAAHLPYAGDVSCRGVADSGGTVADFPALGDSRNLLNANEKDAASRDLATPGGSASRRTRTYNPLTQYSEPSKLASRSTPQPMKASGGSG